MTRVPLRPGFALNVDVGGSGPAIVLLHGFTGSSRGWGEFGRILQQQFTTVAPDIVGHGHSDSPGDLDQYRMPQVVDDLVEAVRLAGWPRATWLGYSMGGRTALHVAAAHPEAVERLVIVGGSPGLATPEERAARVSADEALASRIETEGVPAFVDYWENIPLFASQRRLPAEQRAAIRAGRLACDPVGLANSLRGMGTGAQEPLFSRLGELRLPVLLLAGSEDEKFSAIARDMAKVIPNAAVEIVPNAGHAAHIDQPEACARPVLAFLSQLRPEGALK